MPHFGYRMLDRLSQALLMASLLGVSARSVEAAEPAPIQGSVEAIEFVSSHHVLCQNTTDLLTGGKPYPAVAWRRQPACNFPISQTGRKVVQVRLSLHLTGIPEGTPFALAGASAEPGLCFRQTGRVSGRPELMVSATAAVALGPRVRRLERAITWTLTVQPGSQSAHRVPLGKTGPHVIYVIRGTPRTTRDPLTVATPIRLERAIAVVQAATAKTGGMISDARLVQELMKLNARYYRPSRHYPHDRLWQVPESWGMDPPGASCISIVGFADLVCKIIGIEGQTQLTAFYGDPEQPHRARRGGLGDQPIRKRGYDGNVWQLFMVDESNTNQGGVGGVGGMNYYEAALEYRLRGKRYYIPGGTDTVLGSPEGVLWVFRSLAWARYDAALGNWVVMEVVGTYSATDADFPRSVSLP